MMLLGTCRWQGSALGKYKAETNEPLIRCTHGMKFFLILPFILWCFGCTDRDRHSHQPLERKLDTVILWTPYNDSADVAANRNHEIARMRFRLIQSRVLDKNEVFRPLYPEVSRFTEADYQSLEPLILEQDIPTIQSHIKSGRLTYEKLVLFFLCRIYKYELNNTTTLHTILAINADAVQEARDRDRQSWSEDTVDRHALFGMPVLLKDNIDARGMKTTAGSVALQENDVTDAYIVERLKEKGAIILGKVNMSEWAYFLCTGCPVGYSAIGGQTLNPYGRGIFETGGSSSGSGTSVAANYAVAAVGTETSGSILSPSGQNSVVGLKPTIGLLSRNGIVPISSTLDTPGPMTKNVVDNAILLDAMLGYDTQDILSVPPPWEAGWFANIVEGPGLEGMRLGVFAGLMESDSLYRATISQLEGAGAFIKVFSPSEIKLDGFITILNIDMKHDLPKYLDANVKNTEGVKITSIADAVAFNEADSLLRIPYGQALFRGILADSTTVDELAVIKARLQEEGRKFFDTVLDAYQLDAILSVNNVHAGYAAVAKYPALTVPSGYRPGGEPVNLTFISKPFCEDRLLALGKAFESLTRARRIPVLYP